MRAEHLGDRSHDVVIVVAVPQEPAIPEILDKPLQIRDRLAEQCCGLAEIDRIAADDQRLEDLQLAAVEPVERPLNAGTRAGPSGQRGQIAWSRPGQIGSTTDQPPELFVASTSNVIGEAPDGGRWSGQGRGHTSYGSWHLGSRLPLGPLVARMGASTSPAEEL